MHDRRDPAARVTTWTGPSRQEHADQRLQQAPGRLPRPSSSGSTARWKAPWARWRRTPRPSRTSTSRPRPTRRASALKINGEQVRLHPGERAAPGEVVQGVSDWLGGRGLRRGRLAADGGGPRRLARGATGRHRPLDGVAELDFQARHTGDLRIEHWQTAAGVARHAWPRRCARRGPSWTRLLRRAGGDPRGRASQPVRDRRAQDREALAGALRGQSPADVRRAGPRSAAPGSLALIGGLRGKLVARVREAAGRGGLGASVAGLRAVAAAAALGGSPSSLPRAGMAAMKPWPPWRALQTLLSPVPLLSFLPPDGGREAVSSRAERRAPRPDRRLRREGHRADRRPAGVRGWRPASARSFRCWREAPHDPARHDGLQAHHRRATAGRCCTSASPSGVIILAHPHRRPREQAAQAPPAEETQKYTSRPSAGRRRSMGLTARRPAGAGRASCGSRR